MQPECNPYFRESINELCWPLLARALRQYLTRLAEDDGAIVRNRSDALEGLFRLLLPHADEAEAVRAALALLVQEGFLVADATSVFVRVVRPPPGFSPARTEAPVPLKLSTARVRKHRERKRRARLLAAATTIGAVAPSCSNGRALERLVEVKLFAELTPLSTSEPLLTNAKCVSSGKQ